MRDPIPFKFDIAFDCFEKADGDTNKRRRIGGIASIETKDQQDETLLQRGLDFSPFLQNGWFNDNHSKNTTDIVGYPDGVKYFKKGETLPSGKQAKAGGHWVEGYLLNTQKGQEIWELGRALSKTDRRLGFSVEGRILQRTGDNQKTVAKAMVRNVAITNCPVNADAQMEVLVKSLSTIEGTGMYEDAEKAVTVGERTDNTAPEGPKTGEGAAAVNSEESLEKEEKACGATHKKAMAPRIENDKEEEEKEDKEENDDEEEYKSKKTYKSLTKAAAFAWVRARLPNASVNSVERIIKLAQHWKEAGKI